MSTVDLVAEIIHVDIDDIGECVEVLVPHMFRNHGTGQHPSRMAHQIFEQGIFLQGEIDPLAASGHFTRGRVQCQIVDLEDAGTLGGAAAKQGANSGELRDELRRELAAPAEEVAPRLVDDIQLLAVEGFHFSIQGVRNNRHTSDVIEIACGNQADVLLKRINVEAIGKL